MRPPLALAVLFAAACAHARPAPSEPAPAVAFNATSMRSNYGLLGRLDGLLSVRNNWVDVVVTTSAFKTYQGDPLQFDDTRLRAAVAACKGSDWEIASESRQVPVGRMFGITRTRRVPLDTTTYTVKDTLRFAVALPREVPPARAWLAFVLEWPLSDAFVTYTIHTSVSLGDAGQPSQGWPSSDESTIRARCR